MKLSAFYILLFFCLSVGILMSCDRSRQNEAFETDKQKNENSDDTLARAAVDQVMNIEEVKQKSAEVDIKSRGASHLTATVDSRPTAKDPYYWIKVAEVGNGNYVAYYTFAVSESTRDVRYYHSQKDALLTLQEWRKTLVASKP